MTVFSLNNRLTHFKRQNPSICEPQFDHHGSAKDITSFPSVLSRAFIMLRISTGSLKCSKLLQEKTTSNKRSGGSSVVKFRFGSGYCFLSSAQWSIRF